jgi:hypothetical protein
MLKAARDHDEAQSAPGSEPSEKNASGEESER